MRTAKKWREVRLTGRTPSGEHLMGTLNDSYDTIVFHRYGAEAANASKQLLTAGVSVVKVLSEQVFSLLSAIHTPY